MNQISKKTALKFCELCNWTYETFVTHNFLFDKNQTEEFNIRKFPYFFSRLSIITQEYCLLQIGKLHDPAKQRGSENLTIGYIVQFGDWGEKMGKIKRIEARLQKLGDHLKPARNKILAHSDLSTLLTNATLSQFPRGLADEYIVALQDLVNEVHKKWIGGPYPFNDLAIVDVEEFLAGLTKIK